MINPNKLGGGAWPYSQSQWMLVGVSGVTPPAPGLSDGDPVTTWTDSSGNGHDATMTGSNRPTFKTNIVNGKPVVRFTATNLTGLNVAAISSISPFRIFAVMKSVDNVGGMGAIFASVANGPGGPLEAGGRVYVQDRANYAFTASNTWFSAWHIFTGLADVAANPALFVDGTSAGALTPGAVVSTADFGAIGYRPWVPDYSDGDIAEIIVYNVALSGTDRANVEKYLGTKYGITVAGGTAVQPDTVSGLVGWWKADSLG